MRSSGVADPWDFFSANDAEAGAHDGAHAQDARDAWEIPEVADGAAAGAEAEIRVSLAASSGD